MTFVIANLPGCTNLQDDILVWAATKEKDETRRASETEQT